MVADSAGELTWCGQKAMWKTRVESGSTSLRDGDGPLRVHCLMLGFSVPLTSCKWKVENRGEKYVRGMSDVTCSHCLLGKLRQKATDKDAMGGWGVRPYQSHEPTIDWGFFLQITAMFFLLF